MKNFFKNFTLAEGLIWGIGVLLVVVFFFAFENEEYLTLVASLVGITALLFVAKGNPIAHGRVLYRLFCERPVRIFQLDENAQKTAQRGLSRLRQFRCGRFGLYGNLGARIRFGV